MLIGSTILSILNVAGMWAISKNKSRAWLGMLILQALWVPYDLVTGQLGFLLVSAAYGWVAWGGWRKAS